MTVAIAGPLMTLPQIYQIFSTKTAQGISLTTWGLYCVSSAVWFLYGLKIKDKPLIIASFLWVLMEALVVAGTVIY